MPDYSKKNEIEIDVELEEILDELNMPEAKKQEYKMMDLDAKKEFVQSHREKQNLTSPVDMARMLNRPNLLTVKRQKILTIFLKISPSVNLTWVKSFGEKGLEGLFAQVKYSRE